jgi:RND family efflux transporter MFP subunit
MAGLITRKFVDVGDQAAPGVPLLEIEDPREYRLEATVDESQLATIRQGMQATVAVDALGADPLPATVAEIVPAGDPGSRSFVVKLDLPEDERLRSGMFGKARFPAGEKPAVTVPASALIERGQLSYVFVVGDDSRARLRLVTTGKHYGDRVEVLSGISEGDRIVVDGFDGLSDAAPVKVG